jgi:hypothetical protein
MRKLLIGLVIIFMYNASCEKDNEFQEYQDRLKQFSSYDYSEPQGIVFSYMDSSNKNLQYIKDKYNLETIAGEGDEISRIINLMFWVNRNLKHDGNSNNPYPPNADNIIETCINENRGVNCRMLATVLNEFYLSMGLKSRFITCKPYEYEFNDCHVVTIVYSNQLDKWIMMDPTFAGYFMDENNHYFGLSEVRERLINNEFLNISDNLNHNKNQYTKKEYKTYMAKNLFRFECALRSEYNYEALNYNNRDYVELIPMNYLQENKSNYIYTRNPDKFWVRP